MGPKGVPLNKVPSDLKVVNKSLVNWDEKVLEVLNSEGTFSEKSDTVVTKGKNKFLPNRWERRNSEVETPMLSSLPRMVPKEVLMLMSMERRVKLLWPLMV